jgi:radical SAM superfamily enzyme YgiQ (UPF0313 family)
MKLLLLQPPIEDFYHTPVRLMPLGLGYLKAAIKQRLPEVDVVIKDYHQGWGRRSIPLPNDLAYLKEYYAWPDQSPFSTFYHYYHFGADYQTIATEIVREKPDLVGISSLFTPYYREVLQCAAAVKKAVNVPVLLGGAHVSAAPELMLDHPSVDWIIRGEGERPLVELLRALLGGRGISGLPNLGFKKEGQIILNPVEKNYPFDEIPCADLSDLPPERYLYDQKPLCFLITSRGCPHRCAFCSVHLTFGPEYRRRRPETVFEEIQQRYREGYRVFDFEDDNLTFFRNDMMTLCLLLRRAFPPGEVQCLAMNGISYQSLDPELLAVMKLAHFTHLNLSLVSLDRETRARSRRPHALHRYMAAVRAAHRLGFKTVSYQILGLPGESLESMIQTLVLAARLPVLIGASPFYLTPRTPMSRNFPPPEPIDCFRARLTALALETESCSREDLFTLWVATRIVNFLKGLRFTPSRISFSEALALAFKQGRRAAQGAEILSRLLAEKSFYAATADGLKPLPKFRAPLFFRLWSQLEHLVTTDGKRIELRESGLNDLPAREHKKD